MAKLKSVLMVSYYFPPYANVSVIRTTKFCKYLPQFGWKPWVLSVNPRYYQGRILDEMPSDVSDIPVFRFPHINIPGSTILIKLLFPVLVFAFVCRHRNRIEAVYLSGSPFYPFPLSFLFKVLLRLPTILDFRDSWSINHGYDGRQPQGYIAIARQWFYGLLERVAIHYADRVVFATAVLQQEYEQLFSAYQEKYHTITNGYDPEDFIKISPKYLVKKKTIILAGQFNIYTPEAVTGLMIALKTLPNLHFIYIGGEHEIMKKTAITYDVESQTSIFSYQSYHEVLKLLAGADYALLTNGVQNGMGTKIFDYLALNKPVLCLVPIDSIITKQFGSLESVVICEPPYSAEIVKERLLELMRLPSVNIDREELNAFSRIETTKKLASIFDQATS